MEKRRLGSSDLLITPIGFGAWALGGGGWAFGWGSQDDQESIQAIHRALDLGINWIDTAAVYGLGHSEEVVARAVQGMANKPYIFTKCERRWDETGRVYGSLKRESVLKEIEDSLRRLQVETIDLYQVHWPDPDEDIEEGWSTLAELQQQGKVRWIGVSNFNVQQMQRAQAIAPITSLQPPYSAIRRDIENDILPYCHQQTIGVIVYSPMQSGLLTGTMTPERVASLPADDWRRGNRNFQEPRLSRNLKLADVMGEIGRRHGKTTAEVAIAWTLRHPAVTGAIVGARRPDQVDGFIHAADFTLTDGDLAQIDAFLRDNP